MYISGRGVSQKRLPVPSSGVRCSLHRSFRAKAQFTIVSAGPGEQTTYIMRIGTSGTRTQRPGGRNRSSERVHLEMVSIMLMRRMLVWVVMMMMNVSRESHGMSSITARTYVFQSFESLVRLRIPVQLEIQLVALTGAYLFVRPGGTVGALRSRPTQVFRCRGPSTLPHRPPNRKL